MKKVWLFIRIGKFEFNAHYNRSLKQLICGIGKRTLEGKFIQIKTV